MIWCPRLERLGLSSGVADTLALVLITIVISYVSIVVGELTAKRLALQRAEGVALALGTVGGLHRASRPAGDLAAGRLHQRRWSGFSAATRRPAVRR